MSFAKTLNHRRTFLLHINTLAFVKAEIKTMLRNLHFLYIVQNRSDIVMETFHNIYISANADVLQLKIIYEKLPASKGLHVCVYFSVTKTPHQSWQKLMMLQACTYTEIWMRINLRNVSNVYIFYL